MSAPIIGLTTYGRVESTVQSRHYAEWYAVPAKYVDAVRQAGGVPILLPQGEEQWRDLLDVVNAVIVIGGGDIHPDNYGGDSAHPTLHRIDPERDASELALVRALAGITELPALCICRGLQIANVALGGTLHEHLPDVVEKDIHRGSDEGWAVQPLEVVAGSRLAEIMGATEISTYSGHHQAVKKLGRGLQIAATAEDGIIEAIELPGHPWFIAVQWHPEVSAADDPTQQRIFNALVQVARENKTAKSRSNP